MMNKVLVSLLCLLTHACWAIESQITPFKYEDSPPHYRVPEASRFTLSRSDDEEEADIVYYQSLPTQKSFPLAVLCGGSSSMDDLCSIVHFHRYFLQELLDLGVGVVTVEQWGVDGNNCDETAFFDHYTRSQRLQDHKVVVDHLRHHPVDGWNGKLIFIGVSEGGPIVTQLTAQYIENTVATINWCGAGGWEWREELWVFLQRLFEMNVECPHSIRVKECLECRTFLSSREAYDTVMEGIVQDPTSERDFLGMTHKYHADALTFPSPPYAQLLQPYLIVAGTQDTIIDSCDAFVTKAKKAGAPVTYFRVEDMDHFIRKRPDIIEASFIWLKEQLETKSPLKEPL